MRARYDNHMGDDLMVVNAAKSSFNRESVTIGQGEIDLLWYLARGVPRKEWRSKIEALAHMHNIEDIDELVTEIRSSAVHWAPFAHPTISLKMEAPVPIRTQCFKHKIGFVESEESRRYISSRPQLYIPEFFRAAAKNVKQGSSDQPHEDNEDFMYLYRSICNDAIDAYIHMVSHTYISPDGSLLVTADRPPERYQLHRPGIAPEQARFILPQGVEVHWTWTGTLAAFARFYNQRTDPHAQKEVQMLADPIGKIIQPLFPHSWAALTSKRTLR